MNPEIKTPVVLMMFNRPGQTRRVFERIRDAKPAKFLVIADGPRASHPTDGARCAEVREIVDKGVDWHCEVLKNYADANLGCKRRVSSGLDWVFDTVEEAIILEDDCLPHPTFFRYCEELLDRYRDEPRVGMISGALSSDVSLPAGESYYFSRYPRIWGWAAWRRFWEPYDVEMKKWPEFRKQRSLLERTGSARVAETLTRIFDAVHSGRYDTWDHQVTFAALSTGVFSIVPAVNLIENIGIGNDSTHTKGSTTTPALHKEGMYFPLTHPQSIVRNAEADSMDETAYLIQPTAMTRLKLRVKKALERAGLVRP